MSRCKVRTLVDVATVPTAMQHHPKTSTRTDLMPLVSASTCGAAMVPGHLLVRQASQCAPSDTRSRYSPWATTSSRQIHLLAHTAMGHGGSPLLLAEKRCHEVARGEHHPADAKH